MNSICNVIVSFAYVKICIYKCGVDYVLCGIASATRTSLHDAMTTQLSENINETSGCFFQLHHDATPFFVIFGRLQPLLMESSEYLVKDGSKCVSVNCEDYVSDAQNKPESNLK